MYSRIRSKVEDLFLATKKEIDLFRSRDVDTSDVRTVCLFLGPYRNLTTLTASLLFLHPDCQVLNHAGSRILGDDRLDFIHTYNQASFWSFVRYAIQISESGKRGNYGGSITLSHAFSRKHKMGQVFRETGFSLRKEHISALVWKESQKVSNHLRDSGFDFDTVFQVNDQLKFILPIRNPLDCTESNLKTGHVRILENQDRSSHPISVMTTILDEIAWFAELEQQHPDRFFHYFAHRLDETILKSMAGFLSLEMNEEWLRRSLAVSRIKSHYEHPPRMIQEYRSAVDKKFMDLPSFRQGLQAFFPQREEG